jgi:hypothetical protein
MLKGNFMSTFAEANQVRLILKMKYSQYAWYKSSRVFAISDGFGIIIGASHVDDKVRKLVAPVVNGVSVKTEVEG